MLTAYVVTTDLEQEAGKTSLREAIALANANPGLDTIDFDSSLNGATFLLTEGPLTISDTLGIFGFGYLATTIDAQQESRVFDITSTAGDVFLSGLTIQGGKTTATGDSGAGIRSLSNGTLSLTGSRVTGNMTTGIAGSGGGIFAYGGDVTVDTCIISGNSTTARDSDGAGLYARLGNVTISSSTITGNSTAGHHSDGGGLFVREGNLSLTDSNLVENVVDGQYSRGGGIFAYDGNVDVTDSSIADNASKGHDGDGGGAYVRYGNVTITSSSISGNSTAGVRADGGALFVRDGQLDVNDVALLGNATHGSTSRGGAIFAYFVDVELVDSDLTGNSTEGSEARGGAVYQSFGTLTLTGSTISGNSTTGSLGKGGGIFHREGGVEISDSTLADNATHGRAADGGGLYGISSEVRLINSTISGNTTSGLAARGGGVFVYSCNVTLDSLTIAGNGTSGSDAFGGGIFSQFNAVEISNSIVAGNSASGSAGPDIFSVSDTLAVRYSLIGQNAGTPLAPAPVGHPDANGNLIGDATTPIDPRLGPLADNGGATWARALLAGSPALDSAGTTTLIYDQRGVPFERVVGGQLDMGAFESQLSDMSPVVEYEATAGIAATDVPLMRFTSTDPNATASDFTVSQLDWGGPLIGIPPTVQIISDPTYSGPGSRWIVVADAVIFAEAGEFPVTVTVVDAFGDVATSHQLTFVVGAGIGPVRHLDRQTGLAGFYFVNGQLAEVLQTGAQLTLVKPGGAQSAGTITDDTDIDAPDFGLTATFDQDQGTITFSDGSVWAKVRQIDGQFLTGSKKVAGIRQLGTELTFTGGTGSKSAGRFVDATTLVATDWGNLQGTLSSDGLRIDWSNGTVWNLIPDFDGDWSNSTGQPTRIEQLGDQLLFVNRVGQTSLGRYIDVDKVDAGAAWGNMLGTIVGDTIQWSNGTSWSLVTTPAGTPELAGVWHGSSGANVRVLQADQVLTFVNGAGQTSPGHFVSATEVFADGWNQLGRIVGNQIQWANGTKWTAFPELAGAYLDSTNAETGINQLERAVTITSATGVVTQGTLVDPTHLQESGGAQRTAVINGNVILWSDGTVWTHLPSLSGNWSVTSAHTPAYTEQAGASVLFITGAGTVLTGNFISPSVAQISGFGVPNSPLTAVNVVDERTLIFSVGGEWKKYPPTRLDDVFADPNLWPFI